MLSFHLFLCGTSYRLWFVIFFDKERVKRGQKSFFAHSAKRDVLRGQASKIDLARGEPSLLELCRGEDDVRGEASKNPFAKAVSPFDGDTPCGPLRSRTSEGLWFIRPSRPGRPNRCSDGRGRVRCWHQSPR